MQHICFCPDTQNYPQRPKCLNKLETVAHFTNIRAHISAELKQSTKSIYVAVAWFTDSQLFSMLCDKAKKGLDVQLIVMDDDITRNCSINYEELETNGGRVYLIDSGKTGILMHNKFCVIDEMITITGSYNWSIKAQSNHENITITKENTLLANLFLEEFNRIKVLYHGKDQPKTFDVEIISKRLLIIDSLIQLNEFEQITIQVTKIKEFETNSEIDSIIHHIDTLDYHEASTLINAYLKKIKTITIYEDINLEQLRWEIKYLEIEIISLENEKTSIEKIISDFVHTYTIAFGDLLLKILKLKKEKLKKAGHTKKSEEYEKAEQEYNKFNDQYTQEKKTDFQNLSEEEQKELKMKYRKAVQLCHPDKFPGDPVKQKIAEKIFKELSDAYNKNDLKRVSEILSNLENGIYEIDENTEISNRKQLEERVKYLREKLQTLTLTLVNTRNDKTYRDVISIKSMDSFFKEEKERLENEIKILENEQ